MKTKIINYFKDLKTEFLILWKDFCEYWSAENIAKRLDEFAERNKK